MQRVSVVGNAGSGKTTLGRALATKLGVPLVELDGIFHQSGWQDLEREEFRRRVDDLARSDAWVIDGNYSAVRDLVWARADTVIWLDLPRHLVVRQVARRTLRRFVLREELWNENREPIRALLGWRPDRNMVLWAWTHHHSYARRYAAAMHDPEVAHLSWVRLRSPAEARRFVDGQ